MIDSTTDQDLTTRNPMFREDRIRAAAYHRYISGQGSGDEVTDWLEAEAEIDAEDESAEEA